MTNFSHRKGDVFLTGDTRMTGAEEELMTSGELREITRDDLVRLAQLAAERKLEFDVVACTGMTMQRALRIRELRETSSWRAIALQTHREWGADAMWPRNSSLPALPWQPSVRAPRKKAVTAKSQNAKIEWPATRKQLYAAGYSREMTIAARPCKRCGKRIEFWKTPAGALMPIEEDPENKNQLLCHYATCPHAKEFRKPEHEPRSTQRELF